MDITIPLLEQLATSIDDLLKNHGREIHSSNRERMLPDIIARFERDLAGGPPAGLVLDDEVSVRVTSRLPEELHDLFVYLIRPNTPT